MITFTPSTSQQLEYVHANGQHIVTLLELSHDRLRGLMDSMLKSHVEIAELRDWSLILSAMEIAIEKAEAVEQAGKAFWTEWDPDLGVSSVTNPTFSRHAA